MTDTQNRGAVARHIDELEQLQLWADRASGRIREMYLDPRSWNELCDDACRRHGRAEPHAVRELVLEVSWGDVVVRPGFGAEL